MLTVYEDIRITDYDNTALYPDEILYPEESLYPIARTIGQTLIISTSVTSIDCLVLSENIKVD